MIPLWNCFMLFLMYAPNSVMVDSREVDFTALQTLWMNWGKRPEFWRKSTSPCKSNWVGIICNNSRITHLTLPNMELIGTLHPDIEDLTELEDLDLSHNEDLTGPIPATIGNLRKLKSLVLTGCSFSGSIPQELGKLEVLYFLALNSNNLSGNIPASLGNLSKLFWLDIGENNVSGTIPISNSTSPGFDQMRNTKHFHLTNNRLSGPIPPELFNSNMTMLHFLADGNDLIGSIPSTIGSVKSLKIIRLDRNSLSGDLPSSLGQLPNLAALYLAANRFTGFIPDLSKTDIHYIDMSNNPFNESEIPNWFSELKNLNTLLLESCSLRGPIPDSIFSIQSLEVVKLSNNKLNGSITLGDYSQKLKLLDLRNNSISGLAFSDRVHHSLPILVGNPICEELAGTKYCEEQAHLTNPTTVGDDGGNNSPVLKTESCYNVTGTMVFRAPWFSDVSNVTRYVSLESKLCDNLTLPKGSVRISEIKKDSRGYLLVSVTINPMIHCFNITEMLRISSHMSSHEFWAEASFGPYVFISSSEFIEKFVHSINHRLLIGLSVGFSALSVILVLAGIYVYRLRRKVERDTRRIKPFASWIHREGSVGRHLKGARWFEYEEIKKSTDNFSASLEVGNGGYGKVYKGILDNGRIVAIKRARQGSLQGVAEFKTEIEFLSRVHHKNLVGLVGFCYEKGEQMLVYEFLSNGTLKDALSGKSEIHLNWKNRIQIALDAATGLAYLHEHANPPIIHRDVKSANILLDESLTAKVSDFGLSLLAKDCEDNVCNQVRGTLGYMDPEYCSTQLLTTKSDVYGFGVVMLELITSRHPVEKGHYIVSEVHKLLNPNLTHYGLQEMIDPSIRKTDNLFGFVRFVDLAMHCVEKQGKDRPSMAEVVQELKSILSSETMNGDSTPISPVSSYSAYARGSSWRLSPTIDYENSRLFDYSDGYTIPSIVTPK